MGRRLDADLASMGASRVNTCVIGTWAMSENSHLPQASSFDVTNELGTTSSETPVFADRRKNREGSPPPGGERRQFGNSYADLSPEAQELGRAVDAYKLQHHRRFINYEELLAVIKSLGYHK